MPLHGNAFFFPRVLTFPPNTFEAKSTAFPVLFVGRGIAALSKPSGIPIDEHPWNLGRASICGELRARLAQGRASALALGLSRPAPVLLTDAECSGVVLLADRGNGVADEWRNLVGSDFLHFRFVFLARAETHSDRFGGEDFVCDLPVAAHFSEPRALISRKTGKKAETRFLLLEKFGNLALWAAETTFPRLHQVRVHAQECGIPVVGDALYGGVPPIVNSSFSRRGQLNKGEERPLYAPPCIHLECVFSGKVPPPDSAIAGGFSVSAPLPDGFAALLKKLRSRRRVF